MERLTIGQMAQLNSISEQTLRLYDKIGLLKPDTINNGNGYRYYNIKQNLVSDNLPQIYFCNVGTILRKNNLEERRFFSSEVFVFVDKNSVKKELTLEIPANTYLCIYCNEFNKEKDYINRLLDAVKKNGYTIIGDYICEVLTELPIFEHNERGMFLRLQVPIKYS
ncbi:effector-binding domain-containing protein [Clostridium pascui]|uniref:MerR family DNA-binding transcriptional regulator n=1 Tax=Clostridium pascui TaxID=46609 RepID=UPI00195A3585|nr:MerR family DNA-binding transcriptional regulator [Clostridium pascui]MBM7871376.1 effector-binding domain-containing protein [Clostridium pascui]